MYGSGIGAVLPAGMRTPRLHHIRRTDEDHLALWWEFIPERTAPWDLADHRRAAFLLARLAARRAKGRRQPAPAAGVQAGASLRDVAALLHRTAGPARRTAGPARGRIWDHPLASAALRQSGDTALPTDMLALADRLPGVLDRLDRLPQTYAHGDASPQNLLLPASQPGTVIVIDWGCRSRVPQPPAADPDADRPHSRDHGRRTGSCHQPAAKSRSGPDPQASLTRWTAAYMPRLPDDRSRRRTS